MSPLRTPEQVEAELGYDAEGTPHVSQWTIRRAVREGKVTAIRGARGKVLFDDAALGQLLDSLRVTAAPGEDAAVTDLELEVDGNPFNFRSRRSA